MNIVRVLLVRFRGVLVRCFLACVRVNSSPLCLEIYDVSEFFFLSKSCGSFNKFNTYFYGVWTLVSFLGNGYFKI